MTRLIVTLFGCSVMIFTLCREHGWNKLGIGNVPDPFHTVIKWRPGGSGLRHTTHIVNVWHATVFCQILYRVERGNLK